MYCRTNIFTYENKVRRGKILPQTPITLENIKRELSLIRSEKTPIGVFTDKLKKEVDLEAELPSDEEILTRIVVRDIFKKVQKETVKR